MSATSEKRTYKIVLVGEGGVGKTTWMKKLRTGEFEKKYVPTLGLEVYSVKILTNRGEFQFNMWDTAGQARFGGLRDGYYVKADGAIAMHDFSYSPTFSSLGTWIEDVKRVCPNIPIVVVGNKKEFQKISHCDAPGYPNIAISARDQYDLRAPLLELARMLSGDPFLTLTDLPTPISQEVEIPSTGFSSSSSSSGVVGIPDDVGIRFRSIQHPIHPPSNTNGIPGDVGIRFRSIQHPIHPPPSTNFGVFAARLMLSILKYEP